MSARPTDIVDAVKEMGKAHEAFAESYKGAFESLRERVEELESRRSSPGAVSGQTREDVEHKKVFERWVRKPHDSAARQALGDFQEKLLGKSLSIGSSADGGFAVPEQIAREIEKLQIKLSPVRDLVKVVRTSTGDYKQLVNIGGADAGWVGESDARTETNTPQLRERAPSFGEVYAYPKTTEWLLDDAFFNVQDWLTGEVAEQFALYEGQAVLTGNGTNKPTGMLNTAPVATADDASPKRDAAAYQYVLTGDNSPAAVDADSLIDLVHTLNPKYLAGASWAMNSTTAGVVRKLKDSGTGAYVWQPGLMAGQPDRLLGFPISYWQDMDNIGGGKLPIAFGNFQRAYLLADRTDIRITLDQVTAPGFVKYYVRRRVGGTVLNNDSLKFLKCL